MHNILLYISIIFAMITQVTGVVATVKGSFRPQRMTRFLITFISFLYVGTLLAQGDTNGIFIAIAQLFGSLVLFIVSLKWGMGGFGKYDIMTLILAFISLIVWQTTSNPMLGLIMSIVTDIISFSPTFVKTWKEPFTEEWRFYASDVMASIFSILSIEQLTGESLTFPIYILILNMVSVVMILGRRKILGKK